MFTRVSAASYLITQIGGCGYGERCVPMLDDEGKTSHWLPAGDGSTAEYIDVQDVELLVGMLEVRPGEGRLVEGQEIESPIIFLLNRRLGRCSPPRRG